MFSEPLDETTDLLRGFSRQMKTNIGVLKSTDIELPSYQCDEKVQIITMEQVETSIGPVGIASRFRDFLQIFKGHVGVINGGDELEVPLI